MIHVEGRSSGMMLQGDSILICEASLYLKFACHYLRMLNGATKEDEARMEVVYGVDKGEMSKWVREKALTQVAKARKLQERHSLEFIIAPAGLDCANALAEAIANGCVPAVGEPFVI